MPNIGGWPSDSANLLASQFAAKNFYTGELSGARLVLEQGNFTLFTFKTFLTLSGLQDLQKDSPATSSQRELQAFKRQMAEAVQNIKTKTRLLSIPDVRRLLLRAASVLIASPRVRRQHMHPATKTDDPFLRWTATSCITWCRCQSRSSLRWPLPPVLTPGLGSLVNDLKRRLPCWERYPLVGSAQSGERRVSSVVAWSKS